MPEFGTAVILCGGKSSRMGFDKCKIKIKDRYLIEIMVEQLEKVFSEVILISNDRLKFEDLDFRVEMDIIPDSGPMGAIYSALKYASSRYVFITACDMPVINIDFIEHMMGIIRNKGVEGVVAIKANYVEPLYAFYSRDMIERFEDHINSRSYKLLNVINQSSMYYVEENEVRRFSKNMSIFTNLNYKADLAALDEIFMGENINVK